uniref:Uncharacterized protein n=1 Tax=Opuntia streptacantha TaxID=393608 RepID=A0A7C9A485_OPUST
MKIQSWTVLTFFPLFMKSLQLETLFSRVPSHCSSCSRFLFHISFCSSSSFFTLPSSSDILIAIFRLLHSWSVNISRTFNFSCFWNSSDCSYCCSYFSSTNDLSFEAVSFFSCFFRNIKSSSFAAFTWVRMYSLSC